MVTQTGPALKNLSEVERTAVLEFLTRVRSMYGRQIQRAMLFGSKARGEATSDSDIDVLLIVGDETWQFRDEICNIGADISLKYDVLLDARVIGAARWQYMSEIRAGLYQNISREAIPLAS
ncbi:MAG TPA: nucleotidyltransferase domain-containing protein [Anaerolineales bacterium]|nr:nucleotidyltransferase domain-containing protein [Anaerolineales bacterium]